MAIATQLTSWFARAASSRAGADEFAPHFSKVKNVIFELPGGSDSKKICLWCRRPGFDPWVGKISWRREWLFTPVCLPGKSHRQRTLAGYSPWGHKESNMTEQLPLKHTGFPGGASGKKPACQCRRCERHGYDPWVRKIPWRRKCNPLQYSCLENSMDREAWWATGHRVAQSQTQLKQLRTHTHTTI